MVNSSSMLKDPAIQSYRDFPEQHLTHPRPRAPADVDTRALTYPQVQKQAEDDVEAASTLCQSAMAAIVILAVAVVAA